MAKPEKPPAMTGHEDRPDPLTRKVVLMPFVSRGFSEG